MQCGQEDNREGSQEATTATQAQTSGDLTHEGSEDGEKGSVRKRDEGSRGPWLTSLVDSTKKAKE